ncbi:MAG TPA: hypothetical protein VGA51_05910 [Casimicrobiaceae bacterium]
MEAFIAGTFDKFADACAAAEELRGSGFVGSDVRVTTNAANREDGVGLVNGSARWPGTLEMLVRDLFDLDEKHWVQRQRTEPKRRGVVSVPIHNADEQSIARAVLYRHRAVELHDVAEGVPVH